jgi:hypothetical protein
MIASRQIRCLVEGGLIMKSKTKLVLALMGGAAVLALTVGLAAFGFTSTARANDATEQPGISHRGGPRPFAGMPGQEDTFLADALGISVEELQSAQTAAYEAAIDQALSDGLITQAQADQLKSGTGLGRGERGFAAGFVFGADSAIDHDSLLADALGISVDELSAAREQAQSARLAQAVADGVITQEMADQMAARQALQAYIDPQAIMAEAIGISEDTLQTYRDEGLSLIDILDQAGLTASEFVAAQQAAYEAAIQNAVNDGVITQAQADQAILAGGLGRFGGHGGRGGFGIRPDRGDFPGMQNLPTAPGGTTAPTATDTSL